MPCTNKSLGRMGGDGCYYKPVTGTVGLFTILLNGPTKKGQAWYQVSCTDPVLVLGPLNGVALLNTAPPPPDPRMVAQQAVSRLDLAAPRLGVSPAPPAPQVVRLPTWLWIDTASWRGQSATAAVGGVSVTATATPVRVSWNTGDGASVSCTGPGTPWRAGMDPAASSPTCGHTYTQASPIGGSFQLAATVTWHITWAGAGLNGDAGTLTTTAAAAVQVKEAGGLNTNGQPA